MAICTISHLPLELQQSTMIFFITFDPHNAPGVQPSLSEIGLSMCYPCSHHWLWQPVVVCILWDPTIVGAIYHVISLFPDSTTCVSSLSTSTSSGLFSSSPVFRAFKSCEILHNFSIKALVHFIDSFERVLVCLELNT